MVVKHTIHIETAVIGDRNHRPLMLWIVVKPIHRIIDLQVLYPPSESSIQGAKMVNVIANDCVACGACADVCPQDAITIDDVAVIDADKCVDCGACVDECPAGAITE